MSEARDTGIPDTATPWSRSAPVLHQGRKRVAEEFFVHPQAVRYCMSHGHELYGDRPGDPRFVMEVTFALA